MVATPSTMLPLGTKAPSFSLPDVCTNQSTDLEAVDIKKGCLIAFVCNHCPYVIHLLDPLVRLSNKWIKSGIKVFLISSNDVENYPDDSPDKMKELAQQKHFQFPYLYDEQQRVAMDLKAECTPEFYLYNRQGALVYRGRLDDSSPGNAVKVSGKDLRDALNALLTVQSVDYNQQPSVGCSIKWK